MRKPFIMIALATVAAVAAAPAMAQLGVGLGAKVGVGANAGGLVNGVQGTVNAADRAVNRTLTRVGNANLALATSADVRSGVVVRDSSGKRIGTVQSVHGNMAMVVQGNRTMHVPLASLYKSGSVLVTNLTRAQLRASADASAHASMKH